jgi:hypothetical protein
MYNANIKVFALAVFILVVIAAPTLAANTTISNLKVESLGADATGPNRFVLVSPSQTQCYAAGSSTMLFNTPSSEPNTSIIYSTLLAAMMADKSIEVIHDGTTYCKIVRVTILK